MKRIVITLGIVVIALLLLNGAMAAPTTFDSPMSPTPEPTPTNTPAINPGPVLQWEGGYPITSKYMTGTVAVMVILPSSDGSIDPDTENWTSEQITSVINEIEQALDWWESIAPSAADLEFQVSWLVAPTGYEPITRDWFDWRTPLIQSISITNDEKEYTEELKLNAGTDWAFTFFVVDSDNDADGAFPSGHVGYAFLCGPSAVCASTAGTLGQSHLNGCVEHEVAHIFCALDQYPGSHACWKKGGWGWTVPNLNSLEGTCQGQTDCWSVMRWPWEVGHLDWYAKGQLGWWPYYSHTYLPLVVK